MKHTIGIFILGAVLGFAGGAGAMLFFFPFLFPPAQVNETVATAVAGTPRLIGETRLREGVSGQDLAHWGRGGIRFYRSDAESVVAEFQPDFETGPGPDYWLYLNSKSAIDNEADFLADAGRIRVAQLKSFAGSQVYMLEAGQFAEAQALTIWCESFGQYIASADMPTAIVR